MLLCCLLYFIISIIFINKFIEIILKNTIRMPCFLNICVSKSVFYPLLKMS